MAQEQTTIRIQYEITLEDYVRFHDHVFRQRIRPVRWIALILTIALVPALITTGPGQNIFQLSLVGGFLLSGFVLPWMARWQARKHWNSTPSMREWRTVTIGEDGISTETPTWSSCMQWSNIVSATQIESNLCLYTSALECYCLIPFRCLESDSDKRALFKMARAHVKHCKGLV